MFSPFGNQSYPAAWHPEPNFRGTYDILFSCIITIGLCMWSAINLNIPQQDRAMRQRFKKSLWLLCALLAPEVVAYTAIRQYVHAKSISRFMKEHLSHEEPRSKRNWVSRLFSKKKPDSKETHELRSPVGTVSSRDFPWSLTHSFYVIMGGFGFQIPPSSVNFLPQFQGDTRKRRTRVMFTPKGFKRLVTHHIELLPYISKEEILDKSKADSFAKFIVCTQASWFCVQFIFRLVQHVPVSLLELNAFAHAICALCIYVFWWHKPCDITAPTIIVSESIWPYIALQSMASFPLEQWYWPDHCPPPLSHVPPNRGSYVCPDYEFDYFEHPRIEFTKQKEKSDNRKNKAITILPATFDTSILDPKPLIEYQTPIFRATKTKESKTLRGIPFLRIYFRWKRKFLSAKDLAILMSRKQDRPVLRLYEGQSLYGFSLIRHNRERYLKDILVFGISGVSRWNVDLSHGDIRRLELAAQAVDMQYAQNEPNNLEFSDITDTLCDYISDIPGRDDMEKASSSKVFTIGFFSLYRQHFGMWLCLSLASAIYGALHLLAWNAPSSSINWFWWRLCAIWLTTGFFVSVPCLVFCEYLCIQATKLENFVPALLCHLVAMPIFIPVSIGLLLYLFARIFVLVASFDNLAHLPPSAFKVPSWSQYFPHIL